MKWIASEDRIVKIKKYLCNLTNTAVGKKDL